MKVVVHSEQLIFDKRNLGWKLLKLFILLIICYLPYTCAWKVFCSPSYCMVTSQYHAYAQSGFVQLMSLQCSNNQILASCLQPMVKMVSQCRECCSYTWNLLQIFNQHRNYGMDSKLQPRKTTQTYPNLTTLSVQMNTAEHLRSRKSTDVVIIHTKIH